MFTLNYGICIITTERSFPINLVNVKFHIKNRKIGKTKIYLFDFNTPNFTSII